MSSSLAIEQVLQKVLEAFQQKFGSTDGVVVGMAPGRVNLIGEHTDYNDGFVLPMTIDRGVYVALRQRDDNECKMYSLNFNEVATWELDDYTPVQQRRHKPSWTSYVMGVQFLLLQRGSPMAGIEGVVGGDIPIGSGLSSSAAIEIASAHTLQHVYRFDMAPLEIIKICQKAENEFVGVRCGIMDQFVSRFGKRGQALFLDCRSLEYKYIPLSFEDFAFLIVDTGIKRELANSAYNERRQECYEAARYFRSFYAPIKSLRDVSFEMLEEHWERLSDKVRRRARHVITENKRVLDAIAALQKKDFVRFGALMYDSHRSLKDDYEVSCAELDWIVEEARNACAFGARLTGAGFGGCALILARRSNLMEISEAIQRSYQKNFGKNAVVMPVTENFESTVFGK